MSDGSFRRSPSGFVSALIMDSTLRNLFVEGRSDRLFIRWALDHQGACQIDEIGDVDLPVASGGNRARAISLADYLRTELGSNEEALGRVRVFVDADFDHLDGNVANLPLMLTDGRTLESYMLRPFYFEKIVRLALMNEKVNPAAVFAGTVKVCTKLAAVREIDRQQSLQLPIQQSRIGSFIDIDASAIPSIRVCDLVAQLLQKSGRQASHTPEIRSGIEDVEQVLKSYDPMYVVHGHDLETVLGEILQSLKYHRNKVQELMRATFERRHIPEYPVLAAVVAFAMAA